MNYILSSWFQPTIRPFPGQLLSSYFLSNPSSAGLHRRLGFLPVAISEHWAGRPLKTRRGAGGLLRLADTWTLSPRAKRICESPVVPAVRVTQYLYRLDNGVYVESSKLSIDCT
jgi:hypothetical protein